MGFMASCNPLQPAKNPTLCLSRVLPRESRGLQRRHVMKHAFHRPSRPSARGASRALAPPPSYPSHAADAGTFFSTSATSSLMATLS